MTPDEKKPASASPLDRWRIPHFELDDEYTQDMSHEDLESLALKLKGYGEAVERREPD